MFYKVEIGTWNEAIEFRAILNRKSPLWVHRGQSNSTWALKTSFEREAEINQLNPYRFKTCESNILIDFKRKASQYIQNCPDDNDLITWLSYIQHYGGPTRLLDFTYSYYVAMYFAVNLVGGIPSVWSININNIIKNNKKISKLIPDKGYFGLICEYVKLANENIGRRQDFNSPGKNGICIVEPYTQECRLGIQQGLFLFPVEIENTFCENLCGAFGLEQTSLEPENLVAITYNEFSELKSEDVDCVQLILNKTVAYEAIDHLRSMNISHATLFPGLDGFARSLNFHFHRYSTINSVGL